MIAGKFLKIKLKICWVRQSENKRFVNWSSSAYWVSADGPSPAGLAAYHQLGGFWRCCDTTQPVRVMTVSLIHPSVYSSISSSIYSSIHPSTHPSPISGGCLLHAARSTFPNMALQSASTRGIPICGSPGLPAAWSCAFPCFPHVFVLLGRQRVPSLTSLTTRCPRQQAALLLPPSHSILKEVKQIQQVPSFAASKIKCP